MHNNYFKVSGNDSLVRDAYNQAIINTNTDEYDTYIRRRTLMEQQQEYLLKHENDINTLKEDLNEIKGLLLHLIKGFN